MNTQIWRKILLLALCMFLMGCSARKTQEQLSDAYVLITKSAGNPYNTHMATGFQQVIAAHNGKAVILEPEKATAEEQISLIRSCIHAGVRSIAIAANDTNALDSVLQEAMQAGIQVSTLDSSTSADSHAVFVNQVSASALAQKLMDAVYELSGGSGTWAILSTTNQAGNQSTWIREMQAIMVQERYRDLRLVDISFGEDDAALSRARVESLVQAYPDLKVLCVPTVIGMRAAAEVLQEQDLPVKLTGLGLPSEMAPYMTGDDPLCPVMYLWDPIAIGRLSAYVSLSLTDGSITGAAGEILRTTSSAEYLIADSPLGGTEVIAGEPQEFTPENIADWSKLF